MSSQERGGVPNVSKNIDLAEAAMTDGVLAHKVHCITVTLHTRRPCDIRTRDRKAKIGEKHVLPQHFRGERDVALISSSCYHSMWPRCTVHELIAGIPENCNHGHSFSLETVRSRRACTLKNLGSSMAFTDDCLCRCPAGQPGVGCCISHPLVAHAR